MILALPPECVHWDVITIPNGPISIGTCKKCHRKREYENFKFPDYNSRPTKRTPIEDQQEMIYDG